MDNKNFSLVFLLLTLKVKNKGFLSLGKSSQIRQMPTWTCGGTYPHF